MLNRAKVLQALQEVQDGLFLDLKDEIEQAYLCWQKICADDTFAQKVAQAPAHFQLPLWQGNINQIFPVDKAPLDYGALSIDGSQIYPDKHQGTTCYLVNIGSVQLMYGKKAHVKFDSKPYVFVNEESELDQSIELVNCKRQELELKAGLLLGKQIKEIITMPYVVMIDGSLVFWHLQTKDLEVKNYFLSRYIESLEAYYQEKLPIIGYISLPKSKEIVNLLRFALGSQKDKKLFEHIVDSMIMQFFLPPFHCSTIFYTNTPIVQAYPEHLKPCFYFIHCGNEIARVEIPFWLTQDQEYFELITSLICDQAQKGQGYPIALAEAHEQAVVKGPDREFFYYLIQKLGIESQKRIFISQKIMKKRRIGI
ncbi:MAG: DNA double-strand break repair nuclease NurA [Candidatus Babeliales bacterium]